MEGKWGFKERWNCNMGKPEMYKSGKIKEEKVWKKGLILTDAARISKWTKHTGFGKKFGNL